LLVSRNSAERLGAAIEHLRAAGPAGADLLIEALLIRHELTHDYGVPEFATAQAGFATLDEAMELATRHFGPGSRQHLRVVARYAQMVFLYKGPGDAKLLIDQTLEGGRSRDEAVVASAEFRALKILRLGWGCSDKNAAPEAVLGLWKLVDEATLSHGENSSHVEAALGAMTACYVQLRDPAGRWITAAAFEAVAQRERPPSPMLLRRAERSLFWAVDNREFAAAERYLRSAEENGAAIVEPDLRARRMRYVHMLKACVLAGQGKAQETIAFAAPLRAELDAEFAKVARLTQLREQSAFFRCVSFAQRQLGLPAEAKQTAQVLIDRCKGYPGASRCEARLLLPRAEAEADGGEYEAALLSLLERRKQPAGLGILPDHLLVTGRALLGLGRVSEAVAPLQCAYAEWLASSDPRGHYAAEAEYWLALAYLANRDPRGHWMLAEARRTLAASPLQSHRNLAGQPVPSPGSFAGKQNAAAQEIQAQTLCESR
jgi:hypothetical protein